jgi:hypothetical protein
MSLQSSQPNHTIGQDLSDNLEDKRIDKPMTSAQPFVCFQETMFRWRLLEVERHISDCFDLRTGAGQKKPSTTATFFTWHKVHGCGYKYQKKQTVTNCSTNFKFKNRQFNFPALLSRLNVPLA